MRFNVFLSKNNFVVAVLQTEVLIFVVVQFRFLPHFQASSALDDVTIPRKHAALVAGRDYDEGSFGADDKVGNLGHVRLIVLIHKVKAKWCVAIFS